MSYNTLFLSRVASLFTVLMVLVSNTAVALDNTGCSEYIGDCGYYDCVNQSLGCGRDAYMKKFGAPYCRQFERLDHQFSSQGQVFSDRVRECLQVEMENDAQADLCQFGRDLALGHHIKCYLANGFCDLPLRDRSVIFRVALPEFFRADFLFTAIKMNMKCL